MIPSCCIVQRGSEHPYSTKCPFYNKIKVIATPNSFITGSVFENYLIEYVFYYIEKVRDEIGDEDVPSIIIYGRHKAHHSQRKTITLQYLIYLVFLKYRKDCKKYSQY